MKAKNKTMKKTFIFFGLVVLVAVILAAGYFIYKKRLETKQQTSRSEIRYYNGVMSSLPPVKTDASKEKTTATSSTDKLPTQSKNSIYDGTKSVSISANDSKANLVNSILQPALYNLYYKEARLVEAGSNRLVYTTYYSFSDQDIFYLASRLINAGYTIKDLSNQAVKATQPGKEALEIKLDFESGTDGSFKIIVTF